MRTTFSVKNIASAKPVLALVGLGFAAMVGVGAWAAGWKDMLAALAGLPAWGWVLVGVIPFLHNGTRFLRYLLAADVLGLPAVPVRRWVLYYTAGAALLATPGKAGILLRLWLLERHEGVPLGRTWGIFLFDLLTDTAATVLLTALMAASGLTPLPGLGGGLWVLLGVVGVLGLVVWPWLVEGVVRFCKPRKRLAWVEGVAPLLARGVFWEGVLMSAGGVGLAAVASTELLAALGTPLPFADVMMALGASVVIGMAAMLPGGLGGIEAGMVGMLHWLGVPLPAAVAFTALYRLATLWIPTAVGWLILPLALRKR